MGIHGLCFDVGISGNCCCNCYICYAKYGDNLITDEEIVARFGENEQKRMLKEYEETL